MKCCESHHTNDELQTETQPVYVALHLVTHLEYCGCRTGVHTKRPGHKGLISIKVNLEIDRCCKDLAPRYLRNVCIRDSVQDAVIAQLVTCDSVRTAIVA